MGTKARLLHDVFAFDVVTHFISLIPLHGWDGKEAALKVSYDQLAIPPKVIDI